MAASTPRALADLPAEVLERIAACLPCARDLASANGASRLFRDAPPGGRSPVEAALRERAAARGHARALPAELPRGAGSWTEELPAREVVLELARAHAGAAACTAHATALVDARGALHTCGEERERNDFGILTGRCVPAAGLGYAASGAVLAPRRVVSLAAVRVRAVGAGCRHLLALSDAGAVYGCGDNGAGQLGLGHTEARAEFARVGGALAAELVVGIGAGGCHSLALTAAGAAYSWGANHSGQLGHGDAKERWEPARIKALDGGVRVGGVAAGDVHTLLLSACGAVYSCGYGRDGRLGHGDQQQRHAPARVEALAAAPRAAHVSAGADHSLVVDAAGGAHSYGFGWGGCLGYAVGGGAQLVPRRIDALRAVRAVRARCRSSTSAVVGADGSVHAFGDASQKVLGTFPAAEPCRSSTSASQKALLGTSRPAAAAAAAGAAQGDGGGAAAAWRVRALARERVVDCALGPRHALFLTADGGVHSCGAPSGALGRGVSARGGPGAEAPREQADAAGRAGEPVRVAGLPPLLT